MKKSMMLVLLAGLVMFSGCKKTTIAKVDVNLVMKEYNMIIEANKTLSEAASAVDLDGKKAVKEINDLKQEISMLEGDAKAKKEELLKRKTENLRTKMGQSRMSLQQQRNDLMVKAFGKIKAVLEAKAKDSGYDVVMDSRPIFYSSENVVDITKEVISILNSEYAVRNSQDFLTEMAPKQEVEEVKMEEVKEEVKEEAVAEVAAN